MPDRHTRAVRALLGLTIAGVALAGCSESATTASTTTPSATTSSASATTTTATTTRSSAPVTKLLVVVVENHSLAQMRDQMPYTYALARQYGYATDYRAITHPSLPNYLAMVSGGTQGVTDDDPPARHRLDAPTVFGRALAAGQTAGTYADAMPRPCATANAGRYAVRHNPWAYFVSERADCARHDLPLDALPGAIRAGALPNAGMLVPDVCNDAHDCSLATADRWFRTWMGRIEAGPDWRSGRLAVVLTADEDDKHSGNTVLTVVAHPSLHGKVVATRLDHYSLARLYAEVTGTAPLGRAASAPSMARAFALPVRR